MQDRLISFALAGGHSVGGCAVLQEYFGDEELNVFSGTIKKSLIASSVSAVAIYIEINQPTRN